MNEKKELKDGNPIHIFNGNDLFLEILKIDAILTFFFVILSKTTNFTVIILGCILNIIPSLLVYVIILTVQPEAKRKYKNISYTCVCPYCGANILSTVYYKRTKCCNCNEEFGLYENKVYKITKQNAKYLESDTDKIIEAIKEKKEKSNFQEIKELKELLDIGAITEQEFEEKKKELLGNNNE